MKKPKRQHAQILEEPVLNKKQHIEEISEVLQAQPEGCVQYVKNRLHDVIHQYFQKQTNKS